MGPHPKTLYGAIIVKLHLRSFRSPCSTQVATISSSRPNFDWLPRAVTVKGGRRPSRSNLPLTVTSTAAGWARSFELCDDNSRGARHRARRSRHNLVFGRSVRIGTMMQSCASAARLRGAGPFSPAAWKAMGGGGSPPPRIILASHRTEADERRTCILAPMLFRPIRSYGRSHDGAGRYLACCHVSP